MFQTVVNILLLLSTFQSCSWGLKVRRHGRLPSFPAATTHFRSGRIACDGRTDSTLRSHRRELRDGNQVTSRSSVTGHEYLRAVESSVVQVAVKCDLDDVLTLTKAEKPRPISSGRCQRETSVDTRSHSPPSKVIWCPYVL
ncbi:uncharacterized protein CLUP02_09566 [Colletotrichum lupini]|uniref:Secreted protein n=1 Tax=Colletotrichum lupini TaxID=145971 RepID=A0A9Q8SVW3_9PEZI|nr:uncharacterized protein CLUP02_09566 [Colletotrichum lupini]UQC84070.1 hypothetical protein CLUP02_09566 [Colletotrichum lupini]